MCFKLSITITIRFVFYSLIEVEPNCIPNILYVQLLLSDRVFFFDENAILIYYILLVIHNDERMKDSLCSNSLFKPFPLIGFCTQSSGARVSSTQPKHNANTYHVKLFFHDLYAPIETIESVREAFKYRTPTVWSDKIAVKGKHFPHSLF